MNKKSILKILIIFMLGMAIGAFVTGIYVKHRMSRIGHHHAGKGFSEVLIHLTEAEGDEQEQLMNLGKEYGSQLKVLGKKYSQERIKLLNSLEQEGNIFLTGTAKEKFQKHLHMMKKGEEKRREKEKD